MHKLLLFSSLCLGLIIAAGCELVDTDSSSAIPTGEEGATADSGSSGGGESSGTSSSFDFTSVTWLGPAYPNTTRDERAVLHSASIDRGANTIRLSYDPLPSDWPKQVNAPGQLVMFEQLSDGSWRGGRVEWLDPGQSVKGLSNIDNGYNGWQKPPPGATMAVTILSADGRYCSNTIITTY